ncbi:MAG: Phosphotransferase enzyme [Bogoriella megaspora]|nr:MAG: Phosphotransferase enzyme [Bogoriella megaspora]
MSAFPPVEYEDFYRYTSGRWLWDEDTRLRERYKCFNVPELKRIAARTVGARSCISMVKLAEGGFNKVFRLAMNNGSVVIARIPNPNAGPSFKTTASEVATMNFARTILEIPVPKVLSWSADVKNPVQSEYILMEEAAGDQLGGAWDNLELHTKLKIVDDIIAIEKKFLSLSFTRYGNLYFKRDAFRGCQKAEITGDLPQSLKKEVENVFVIGPVVDRDFWHRERATMDIDRGPCEQHYIRHTARVLLTFTGKRPRDYLQAVGQREIAWIGRYAATNPPNPLIKTSEAQRNPEAHTALYKKFLQVADYLLPSDHQIRPTLWHWDIHAPNIFVHGDQITNLIDWQDTWLGPLFLQAQHPRLVDYDGKVMLRLPENYETLQVDEKARVRTQVERSIILWAYETESRKANPIVHDILHLCQGRTRRDTVAFSANTWDKDIIPFRQCLIRVARHWSEINSEIPCPINFTEEEIRAHHRDGEGWNETADFWDSLQGVVDRDGWTSNENYDQAIDYFAQLREQGLQNLNGEERSEFEKDARWAVRNI